LRKAQLKALFVRQRRGDVIEKKKNGAWLRVTTNGIPITAELTCITVVENVGRMAEWIKTI